MMRILISGASGLVGSHLSKVFTDQGFEVVSLSRSSGSNTIQWDVSNSKLEASQLENFDYIYHLAGESIAGLRWTAEKKKAIYNSRIEGTKLLVQKMLELKSPPKAVFCASAIGYYNAKDSLPKDESSAAGNSFLAKVCRDWEACLNPLEKKNIRSCAMRIGIVLSHEGGALQTMAPAFKMGLGGKLGDGTQYMPWIDLDDLVRAMDFLREANSLSGPVNMTAPHPVMQKDFAETLAQQFHRPSFFHAPKFILKMIAGELAEELMLGDYNVIPKKLLDAGFKFKYNDLRQSLKNQLAS